MNSIAQYGNTSVGSFWIEYDYPHLAVWTSTGPSLVSSNYVASNTERLITVTHKTKAKLSMPTSSVIHICYQENGFEQYDCTITEASVELFNQIKNGVVKIHFTTTEAIVNGKSYELIFK